MEVNVTPLTKFKEQFTFVPEVLHQETLGQHTNVVVCGMGGSAICVSLLKMLFPELPLTLHNSYGLPPVYDKQNTLIILNSYSGNTEEILEGFERGIKEQAHLAVLSCGGKLIDKAKESLVPYIQIPANDLEPRFSIGYQLIGLLTLMGEHEKINTLKGKIELLQLDKTDHRGKELAEKLDGKYPIIYSSAQFYPVAYLIKAAINEGSKTPCFVNCIPEANHNELQSFIIDETHDEREYFAFLFIRSIYDHQRISKRFSVMQSLYGTRRFVIEVIEKDTTNITEVFEAILTGYFLATYLAQKKNVDPYKTPFVQEFKGIMAS